MKGHEQNTYVQFREKITQALERKQMDNKLKTLFIL